MAKHETYHNDLKRQKYKSSTGVLLGSKNQESFLKIRDIRVILNDISTYYSCSLSCDDYI